MPFQEKAQAAHTTCGTCLINSALSRGFPILTLFKNISQMLMGKLVHLLLQNKGCQFILVLVHFFVCVCGKEFLVLVRVDFWI